MDGGRRGVEAGWNVGGSPASARPPDRQGLAIAGLVLGVLATLAVLGVIGLALRVADEYQNDDGEDLFRVAGAVVLGIGAVGVGLVGIGLSLAAVLGADRRPATRRAAGGGLVLSLVPVVALAALIVHGRWG